MVLLLFTFFLLSLFLLFFFHFKGMQIMTLHTFTYLPYKDYTVKPVEINGLSW